MQTKNKQKLKTHVITGHHYLQENFKVFIVTIAGMLYMVNINNTESSQQCSMIGNHYWLSS